MTARRSLDRQALAVVEAAYRLVDRPQAWVDGVMGAAKGLLDRGAGVVSYTYRIDGHGRMTLTSEPRFTGGELPPYAAEGIRYAERTPPTLVRHMFAGEPPIVTLRSLWSSLPHERFPDYRLLEDMSKHGLVDYVAVRGCDPTGAGLMLGALVSTAPQSLCDGETERWRLLRAHLLAGLRLRGALEDEAVIEPGGRVVHAEGDARGARARDALRRCARDIDRARGAPGRRDPAGALRAWHALVSGRWSLIDRFDADGRRYFVARRNDPHLAMPRPLSARERQVLAYAALGYANKHIAYTLGLAPSTVSAHLRNAMRRVGATSRASLAELWLPAAAELAEAANQPTA